MLRIFLPNDVDASSLYRFKNNPKLLDKFKDETIPGGYLNRHELWFYPTTVEGRTNMVEIHLLSNYPVSWALSGSRF